MGAVYLAHQQGKETTPLAIKENIFYIDDSMRNQFEREASVLMGLNHPNLPKVSDHFFETSGKQYLVMEYVDGDDLQQWLRKHKTVPEDKALAWADELLSTLTYLHTRPKTILHRDIKPSNIKITPQGKLVLIDFGLVKLYGGDLTSVLSSQRGFTPNYAPPEQANGNERTDPSSDLYAVGATLYHLLSGQMPAPAGDRAADTQLLLPLRKLRPDISNKTEALVQKAMSLSKTSRFQSAEEMRQAVAYAQTKSGRIDLRSLRPVARGRLEIIFTIVGVIIMVIGLALLTGLIAQISNASPSTLASNTTRPTAPPTPAPTATAEPTNAPTATEMINPTATPNPTSTLPKVSAVLPSALPTRTATATTTPTKLPVTETPSPTPLATRTPIPTRTRVPTATPNAEIFAPTATPFVAQAAAPSLSSPSLFSPAAGASFTGNANPTFSWSSAGNLGTFDYYQFQIQHGQGWDVICTKNTSTQARSYVPTLGPFQWTVNVVRLSSAIGNGAACSGSIVASAGEVRGISWSANTGGGQSSSGGARPPTPSGGSSAPSNPTTVAPSNPPTATPSSPPIATPSSPPTTAPCVPGPGVKC